MMLDEIPIDDVEWRNHWFDTVMKQVEPIIIRFYNRYLEHNDDIKVTMADGDTMSDIISYAEPPSIKFYRGKRNGSSSYSEEENLIRVNMNNLKDEKDFTDTIIHEVTHWIMDKVFEGKLNSPRDHHNHWYWIMYIEVMNWFGLERRTVSL